MSNKVLFTVSPRTITGKKVKQLRRQGIVPGHVYGSGEETVLFQSPMNEFRRLYDKAGETTVIYLKLGDDTQEKPVLVDEVMVDPLSGELIHVSFKQVNLREKIEAEIPVETVGEFKVANAVLVMVQNTIKVESLPTDLPEKFEIDVEALTEIGQMVTLGDLAFDKQKITLVGMETDEDLQAPVLLVQEQQEEESEAEEAAPAEVEITGEKPAEAEAEAEKTE